MWGQNWLWFLPVLFLFGILYLLLSRVKIKLPDFTLKQAVGSVFLIGLINSIFMDLLNLEGWTKTILLDFQNERLLIYFLIFLLGSHCYKLKSFDSKPKNRIVFVFIICMVWIPVLIYRYFYLTATITPGTFIFSETIDMLLLWLSFHLSLLCLLYLMITTFMLYLDKQGEFSKLLNNNSYPVYIIHTVVMGALAYAILNTALPSLLKFLLLTILTFAVSNLFIYVYREVILKKLILKSLEAGK